MRKLVRIVVLVTALACTATAFGQYQWTEDFSTGIGSWTQWTERGTAQNAAEAGWAHVGGDNFNGGIYKTIALPLGAGTYTIDGLWKTHGTSADSFWAEVLMYEGVKTLNNGADYNPGQNGTIADGETLYKNDTWTTKNGWNGQISATAPVFNSPSFTTTTGTITLVLKTGNTGGTGAADFDDMSITPEPAAALLLGLPLLFVRRRRA